MTAPTAAFGSDPVSGGFPLPEGERRVLAIQPIGAEYVFTAECGAVKGSCGIALFYDPRASVGLTLKDGGLWQTAGDIQVFAGDWTAAHAWLRLRLRGQVVSMSLTMGSGIQNVPPLSRWMPIRRRYSAVSFPCVPP